ncbi:PHD/YefM family antitoxin component YafN of YafNO toxin-antitoxin module [Lactobacillus colini]|uniref:Antitoxin n=1 Tax=Lactobacillus colini TaxID=1819254 RepID=A0ABS4MCL2_9LACO|nr:type II toxin-antitoxin system Phd/YefM family antitoxin [Lactobacillus colini]MBP2057426.1 PHD/YefM family antitoxin component YafN of YafNO toxin-antitoxin module [Lactobacillus colini]
MEVITPTNFRKDIYNVLKNVVKDNKPVEITITSDKGFNDGVIMMDKKEYNRLKELEYLEKTGTLQAVLERMEKATDDDFEDL